MSTINSKKSTAAAAIVSGSGASVFVSLPLLIGGAIDALALNEEQAGLIGSSYHASFLLVGLSAVFWIRRMHWQQVSLIGYTLMALGLLAAGFSESFMQVVSAMFISGIGAGILFCLPMCIIGDSDSPERGFGYKIVGEQTIGVALLLLLPIYITETWGFRGMCIALAAMLAVLSSSTVWVPAGGKKSPVVKAQASPEKSSFPVWLGLAALAIFFGGVAGVFTFVERIALAQSIDHVTIGVCLAIGTVSGGVVGFIVGIVGNRFGQVLPLVIACLAPMGVYLVYSMDFTAVTFAMTTIVYFGAWNLGLAYQNGIIASADVSGRLSVLMAPAIALGAMISPVVAGMIINRVGFQTLYWVSATVLAVSLVMFLWVLRTSKNKYFAVDVENKLAHESLAGELCP